MYIHTFINVSVFDIIIVSMYNVFMYISIQASLWVVFELPIVS